jgi:hypothetical protein
MNELEISELNNLQDNINYFSNELSKLDSSRRFVFGTNQVVNNRCEITFANSTVHISNVPNITQSIFNIIETAIRDHLNKLLEDRDKLTLCIKTNTYKPIDILDKL